MRDEPYLDRAALKVYLSINGTGRDDDVDLGLGAASDAIDEACGRVGMGFWPAPDEPSEMFYTATRPSTIEIDDVVEVTELAIDTTGRGNFDNPTIWVEGTDFVLEPENAVAKGRPYERIKVHPFRRFVLPQGLPGAIRVTARFGWPGDEPYDGAVQMTKIIASKLIKRKEAPQGIVTFGTEVAMRILVSDPDFPLLLGSLVRDPILA